MIRVAYVVHTFDMGGLEKCVARLANHLDRSRFRPLVICMWRNGSASEWIHSDDVPILELGKRRGNDPRLIPRLVKAIRRHEVDVVHSHNWGTLVETALAAGLSGTRHVHAERGTVLGTLERRGLRRWLRGRAMKWALGRADAVVAVSESVRQRMVDSCSFPAERVQVIPNGVDVPRMDPEASEGLRERLGVERGDFVVGSVGRLKAVKDFPTAIHALARLRAQGCPAHLVIVGGGPDRDALLAQAVSSGVADRVHLVGQQSDVGSWLAAMDVYLNSSISEGMSQSILEAMAAGLPLVVTSVGESPRLVNGNEPCGVVVDPGDAPALSAALEGLWRGAAERQALASRSRSRHAAHHSVETMVRTYEALYSEVCAR